jgi:hypothetical protein
MAAITGGLEWLISWFDLNLSKSFAGFMRRYAVIISKMAARNHQVSGFASLGSRHGQAGLRQADSQGASLRWW